MGRRDGIVLVYTQILVEENLRTLNWIRTNRNLSALRCPQRPSAVLRTSLERPAGSGNSCAMIKFLIATENYFQIKALLRFCVRACAIMRSDNWHERNRISLYAYLRVFSTVRTLWTSEVSLVERAMHTRALASATPRSNRRPPRIYATACMRSLSTSVDRRAATALHLNLAQEMSARCCTPLTPTRAAQLRQQRCRAAPGATALETIVAERAGALSAAAAAEAQDARRSATNLDPHALNSRITPSARASHSRPSPSPSQSPPLIPSPQIELVAVPSPQSSSADSAHSTRRTQRRQQQQRASHKTRLLTREVPIRVVPVPVPIPNRRRRAHPHPRCRTQSARPKSMPCAQTICASPSTAATCSVCDSPHALSRNCFAPRRAPPVKEAAATAIAEAKTKAAVESRCCESSAPLIHNFNQLKSQQNAKYISILLRRKLRAGLLFETCLIIGILILANLPARSAAQPLPAHLNKPLVNRPDDYSEALSARRSIDPSPRLSFTTRARAPNAHPSASTPSHNPFYYRSTPESASASATLSAAYASTSLSISTSTSSQLESASSGSLYAYGRVGSRRATRSGTNSRHTHTRVGSADCLFASTSLFPQRSPGEATARSAGRTSINRRRRSLDEYLDLKRELERDSPATSTASSTATAAATLPSASPAPSQSDDVYEYVYSPQHSTTRGPTRAASAHDDAGVLVLPNKCLTQSADNESLLSANDTLEEILRELTRPPLPNLVSSRAPFTHLLCNASMIRQHLEMLRPNLSSLSDSQFQEVLDGLELEKEKLCYEDLTNSSSGVSPAELDAASSTLRPFSLLYPVWATIPAALLGVVLSLTTVAGNLVVLGSFVIERAIRTANNYFIFSLAASDLLIGLFSMPFYSTYLLLGEDWPLGAVVCNLWLSLDYTF